MTTGVLNLGAAQRRWWLLARLAMATSAFGGAAHAGPVTMWASAEAFDHTAFVELVRDDGSPIALGISADVSHSGGPMGSSLARSLAREDGFIAAGAQVSAPEGGHRVEWSTHSAVRYGYRNEADTVQAFFFDFDIFAMSLRLLDLEGVSQTASIRASVQINPAVGAPVVLFVIDETLTGGAMGHSLNQYARGVTPNSNYTCLEMRSRCVDFRYDFDPIHAQIPLGVFQPGESFDLHYVLQASATAATFSVNAASAFIGDPFDVNGVGAGGRVRAIDAGGTAVPVPATWMLLGVGGALLARRRRAPC